MMSETARLNRKMSRSDARHADAKDLRRNWARRPVKLLPGQMAGEDLWPGTARKAMSRPGRSVKKSCWQTH